MYIKLVVIPRDMQQNNNGPLPIEVTRSSRSGSPAVPSKLAERNRGQLQMIKDYIARHTQGKTTRMDFCYRHHPSHSNLVPDKYTMAELQSELETLPREDCEVISHMWNLFSTASSLQRQIIMKGMLSQCCFPQLSKISSTTKDLLRIDFIASLPIELSFMILGYLDAKSLCNASMVSKTWKQLADDDVVWYHLCEQHIDRKCTTCGWGLPLLERRRLRRGKQDILDRLETLTEISQRGQSPFPEIPASSASSTSPSSASLTRACSTGNKRGRESVSEECSSSKAQCREVIRSWKDVYLERFKIERNWRLGKCLVKDFQHTAPILCLQFDEQLMMTGTMDGVVTIWDVETKKKIRHLQGHIRGVSALKFDSNKLVTGSWDQSVRVWNYRTGQCLCTFGGHESKILCIDFDSNLIAAGSADATIKIWDFVTKSCFTLRGHTKPVHSVRLHKESSTLFTSSEDLTVRMWCLEAKKCIRIFGGPGPLAHVAGIQYALPITLEHLEGESEHDHHILTSSDNDGSRGSFVSDGNDFIEADASLLAADERRSDEVHGARSVSPASSPDATDRDVPQHDHSPETEVVHRHFNSHNHNENDQHHATRPTHLLTASLDNTIKLWDIQTGRCARTLFGHIEGVWCIAADHFRIVSGAQDKLVKVWDVQSGKCWHTFSGHTNAVSCVGLTDTGFASGGDDGLVRLHTFDFDI